MLKIQGEAESVGDGDECEGTRKSNLKLTQNQVTVRVTFSFFT